MDVNPTCRATLLVCLLVLGLFRPETTNGALPPEKIILLPAGSSTAEDAEISRWQERVRAPESQEFHYERLGWAFVAKARRTQDAGCYRLAEAVAEAMAARFGPSPDAQLLRGHALHNLHRFAEAEQVARALVAQRGLAADHALWSDSLLELGRIDEAVAACQRAVDLRPGTESFARVAHLRWLKGDLAGAESALVAALAAASTSGAETRAWLAVRLSGLRLQSGDAAGALRIADQAAALVPDYAPALLAGGRALLAQARPHEAAVRIERGAEFNPLPEYQWWLAEAVRAADDPVRAAGLERELEERGEASDPRTLSLFLATRGRAAARAVALAEAEQASRNDGFTHDAVAWARFAAGDLEGADRAMALALAHGIQDARLRLHAGLIAAAAGRAEESRHHLELARRYAGSLTPSERALLPRLEAGVTAPNRDLTAPSTSLVGNQN